eukprot:5298-Heterococcus_DN1.PRE.2
MIEKKDIKTINHPELYQIVAKLCKYDHPMADTVKLENTSIASFRADVLRACKVYCVHLHKRSIHNDVMPHIVQFNIAIHFIVSNLVHGIAVLASISAHTSCFLCTDCVQLRVNHGLLHMLTHDVLYTTGFSSMRSLRKCLIRVAREIRERRGTTGEAVV